MRILVLSDSHYKKISLALDKYDAIIHAGDMGSSLDLLKRHKAYYVRGNCDLEGPKELSFNLFNKKIYLTHGDLYNVKYNMQSLVYRAVEKECSIAIYGHTHQNNIFMVDNILFINPGAYKDGYYIEINDDSILLYNNNEVIKKIKNRW